MKKLICILFFLLPLFLHAQKINVDSLVSLLETNKLTNKEQFKIYKILINEYRLVDLEKTKLYGKKGLSIAEKEKDYTSAGRICMSIGQAYGTVHGESAYYDSLLIWMQKSLDYALKANDEYIIIRANNNIGAAYLRQEKYITALDYFYKCLDVSEKTKDKEMSMLASLNIGSIYRTLYDADKAILYFEKAEGIAKERGDYDKQITALAHISLIYCMVKKDYDKAFQYANKAIELSKEHNNKYRESESKHRLGLVYRAKEDYDQAAFYANESLQLAEETNNWYSKLDSWDLLADIYYNQKKYQKSIDFSMFVWKNDSTGVGIGTSSAILLGLSNMHLGNYEKAEYFLNKYTDIMKENYNSKIQNTIADMETKYETQKKELRISDLEKERKLYIILGIAVVVALLLGLGLLYYRHRLSAQKQKIAEQHIKQLEQEKKLLEQEKELIAARSALDAEKAEREIIARDLHDGVGAMLSVVKNNMNIMKSYSVIDNKEVDYFNKALDGLDKSIVELRRVAHHIMPAVLMEKGLFAALDDFCRSIPEAEFHYTEPERRFDSEKELVLYRCAYELVNNAMKHAGATKIEVHLNVDETTAYLSVVDNGSGFDIQNAPQGMGIKNLRTRLSAFGGNIEFFSEPGGGTEANVELKI